ncbi:hypothetical protein QFZ30_002095 [Arthrobacter pascens]|nr:hypothetical protein [Arthrobacter pascens]MDQ0678713.1 hypothetical protein [Arthrobacter pascens]
MTLIDLKPLACPVHATSGAVGSARFQDLMGDTSGQKRIGHKTEPNRS